jgi:peroxiredoxin (alkyl hydroperoxide reductase subunit C)
MEPKEDVMPKDFQPGCAKPVEDSQSGKNRDAAAQAVQEKPAQSAREVSMIKVGKKAPNFTAPAYFQGKFVTVELNEYLGKWVLLCFYPGDFTFV